jgi:hypothetical protein
LPLVLSRIKKCLSSKKRPGLTRRVERGLFLLLLHFRCGQNVHIGASAAHTHWRYRFAHSAWHPVGHCAGLRPQDVLPFHAAPFFCEGLDADPVCCCLCVLRADRERRRFHQSDPGCAVACISPRNKVPFHYTDRMFLSRLNYDEKYRSDRHSPDHHYNLVVILVFSKEMIKKPGPMAPGLDWLLVFMRVHNRALLFELRLRDHVRLGVALCSTQQA